METSLNAGVQGNRLPNASAETPTTISNAIAAMNRAMELSASVNRLAGLLCGAEPEQDGNEKKLSQGGILGEVDENTDMLCERLSSAEHSMSRILVALGR